MYHLPNVDRGFSSKDKLMHYLTTTNGLYYLRKLAGVPRVGFPANFQKCMTVVNNGSVGEVYVNHYLMSESMGFFINPKDIHDVICDPPIKLCEVRIY